MIKPYLNAANVDLKSFSEQFYKQKVDGRLKPVLDNIRLMYDYGIWVEVTTLLIPGLNDSSEELENIAKFLVDISNIIPWHISAYYPQYKSSIPSTEIKSIIRAIDIGKKAGLKYVYGGNIPGSNYENTTCPHCGAMLIKRLGFSVIDNKVKDNICSNCGANIDGKF
jgi:pyruvate formate lyase activating enzyme